MNSLNSIILEGTVDVLPTVSEFENLVTGCTAKKISFPLTSVRKIKNVKGEDITEEYHFDIESYGNMADACEKYIKEGCGVRIVGRLKQSSSDNRVFVVAEHVEFKPMRKSA